MNCMKLVAMPLLATALAAQSAEPPLLTTSGSIAKIYTGKLVAFQAPVVTVHGDFIPEARQLQAIKCKLSSQKTRGIRYYDTEGSLLEAVVGSPGADPAIVDTIRRAVGRTVKVGPLGEDCMHFEIVGAATPPPTQEFFAPQSTGGPAMPISSPMPALEKCQKGCVSLLKGVWQCVTEAQAATPPYQGNPTACTTPGSAP